MIWDAGKERSMKIETRIIDGILIEEDEKKKFQRYFLKEIDKVNHFQDV